MNDRASHLQPLSWAIDEVQNGASIGPEDFADDGFPVLHKGAIQIGGQLNFTREANTHVTQQFADAHADAIVDDGFIVATLRNLVKTGETLGFMAPVPKGRRYLLAQGAYGLRLNPKKIDGRYLAHLSNAWIFHKEVLRRMVGTTQVHIRNGDFLGIEIPVSPLPEQRRIAEILDKADALRAKRRAVIGQLDTLTQSIFLDMFGDPATNSKGWRKVLLGSNTLKVGSGSTPTGGEANYKSSGIALIRSMNIRDGSFLRKDLAHIDEQQAAQLAGVIVEEGDVLLNITGASVARVCRAPSDVIPARVNQHVAIIRPKSVIDGGYLEQLLLTDSMKAKLLRIAGAGATREAITKLQIEELEVVCPPIELQRQFAQRVAALGKLKLAQHSSLAQLDSLFSALQHRAFRGEL